MRLVHASAIAVAAALLLPAGLGAQNQDADRSVEGGGIMAEGWMGKLDARGLRQGMTVNDSKFMMMGNDIHATIGPAAVYWNPANTAMGDYTVKATIKEIGTDLGHPHPAGVFIGGSGLDGDAHNLVYCTVYGTGEFLVGRFSGGQVVTPLPAPKTAHEAIHKPDAEGNATNEVAWRVSGSRAECLVNGAVVAGFNKADLGSTDGVFGLRFSHNMEAMITGFGKQ